MESSHQLPRSLPPPAAGSVDLLIIAGEHSEETRMAGAQANARLFAPRFHVLPHGHLIPMEAPQACADAVLQAIAVD